MSCESLTKINENKMKSKRSDESERALSTYVLKSPGAIVSLIHSPLEILA